LQESRKETARAYKEARNQLEKEHVRDLTNMKGKVQDLQRETCMLENELRTAKNQNGEMEKRNEQLDSLYKTVDKNFRTLLESCKTAQGKQAVDVEAEEKQRLESQIASLKADLANSQEAKDKLAKELANVHSTWMEERLKQPTQQRETESSGGEDDNKRYKTECAATEGETIAEAKLAQQKVTMLQNELKELREELDKTQAMHQECQEKLHEKKYELVQSRQRERLYKPYMETKDLEVRALREELSSVHKLYPTTSSTSTGNAPEQDLQDIVAGSDDSIAKYRDLLEKSNNEISHLRERLRQYHRDAINKQESIRSENEKQRLREKREMEEKVKSLETFYNEKLEIAQAHKDRMHAHVKEIEEQTSKRLAEIEHKTPRASLDTDYRTLCSELERMQGISAPEGKLFRYRHHRSKLLLTPIISLFLF
jgi:gamma-glutamylcyclotransferase (GGCT)/AIG2-like uncharacterized protein YtfP